MQVEVGERVWSEVTDSVGVCEHVYACMCVKYNYFQLLIAFIDLTLLQSTFLIGTDLTIHNSHTCLTKRENQLESYTTGLLVSWNQ